MTMTEKILARAANLNEVIPGQEIVAELDLLVCSEISGSLAIDEFHRGGFRRVSQPQRIALIPDHFIPPRDVASATQVQQLRKFAQEQEIQHFYELGRGGIEHCVVLEEGLALPGQMLLGADSHCCTYGAIGAVAIGGGSSDVVAGMISGCCWLRVPQTVKIVCHNVPSSPWLDGKDIALHLLAHWGLDGAGGRTLEFSGPGLASLPMHWRITLANMLTECGAENTIFPVDSLTRNYLSERTCRPWTEVHSDPDAQYSETLHLDLAELVPLIALPDSPAQAVPVAEIAGTEIDQVFIGSCTSGSLADLAAACHILGGRTVHPKVRVIVLPGTQRIYAQALELGYIQQLTAAGALVGPSGCGPCFGGHLGVLAKGERAVSTSNRNFPGRMGHSQSQVFLASVATAAASAIAGRLISPDEVMG